MSSVCAVYDHTAIDLTNCGAITVLSCMQIAADNAVFGQTGPKVGSFDAGYGSSQMVRLIGTYLSSNLPSQ